MKSFRFSQSVWYEVGTGVLLLVYGAGTSIFSDGDANASLLSSIAILAYSAIFLSHVVARLRAARLLLLAIAVSAMAALSVQGLVTKDFVQFALLVILGAGLFISDKGIVAGLGMPTPPDDAERPELPAFAAGATLFAVGTAFAGTAVWPEWFMPHIDHLLFGSGWYLVTSFAFVFAGTAVIFNEMKSKDVRARIFFRILAAVMLLALASSYLYEGLYAVGALFVWCSVMVAFGGVMRRLHIIVPGLDKATLSQKMVFQYAYAGRITVWLIVMMGAYLILSGLISDITFFSYLLVAVVSVYFFNTLPITRYSPKDYLIALGILTFAFDAFWSVSGGVSSPFIFISFLIILASSVASKPFWTPVFAGAVWIVPLSDIVFLHRHHHDFENFLVYTVSILFISMYAYLIGKRKLMFEEKLRKTGESMKKALLSEESIKKKFIEKTKTLEGANRELVEMRSALLNVLEDVENTNRQLKNTYRRQDAVFSSIGEGLVAADTQGTIILANTMASTILGLAREEIIGKQIETVLKFYEGESKVLDTSVLGDVWSGGGGKMKDNLFILDSKDHHVPIAGSVASFLDDKGRISGIVAAFRDVTIEREVEQQKSSFITVASHQLRTPINAVRWYVDLFLEGDAGRVSKLQREYLGDISTSITRMAALIDDLLEVSRAEEGRMELVFEEISPEGLVREVLREIGIESKKKEQTFEVDIPEGLPNVWTDKKAASEVLENLLSNAVKYTPDGGKLGLRITEGMKGVQFEVWDTGYGIPKEHQHHVFEKFYRGKRAVTLETEGTGLGLYIANRIIRACKGEIWFHSNEGKGSQFFFSLPTKKPTKSP